MVANLLYLQAAEHAGGPNVVFAKASNPSGAAAAVARATAADGTIVKNISQQTQQTVSSITTVDLRGISHIEEAFTIALAAAAMALFVALAVIERRHEFATMAAVGATLRSIGAFVWSEAALVLAAALLLAAGLGLVLALMLVAMLQHVFDPPPAAVALAVTAQRLRRLPLGQLLREQ
jgi:putative ABC transport system permease protein